MARRKAARSPGSRSTKDTDIAEKVAQCQSMLDAIDEEILIIDRSYTVVAANQCLLRDTHRRADQVIGRFCHEVSHGRDTPCERPDHLCPLAAVWDSGEPVHVLHVHPGTNGKQSYVDIVASPLRDERGEVVAVIETMRDVTESKQGEILRQEYVSLISHDLRTPLTVILGQSELLRRYLARGQTDKLEQGLESIVANTKRMNAMIQDLVDCVRLEGGQIQLHREAVHLPQLVAAVIENMPKTQGRVRVDVAGDVPTVFADRDKLHRVLANLIGNALKYSDGEVAVRVEKRGREVGVAVRDHGIGVPSADQPHIFERFYRAANRGRTEGLGLGLYISSLLVQTHGGRIWLESEPGKGSTFHFALPIVDL